MAIPDRQINPPSFFEKNEELTSYTLQNDIDEMEKEMRSIETKIMGIEKIIEKAKAKLEKIKVSEAIPYMVAGGYFERQNDLLSIEYVIARLNQWIERNDKRWEQLEEKVAEYQYKLDNI